VGWGLLKMPAKFSGCKGCLRTARSEG